MGVSEGVMGRLAGASSPPSFLSCWVEWTRPNPRGVAATVLLLVRSATGIGQLVLRSIHLTITEHLDDHLHKLKISNSRQSTASYNYDYEF